MLTLVWCFFCKGETQFTETRFFNAHHVAFDELIRTRIWAIQSSSDRQLTGVYDNPLHSCYDTLMVFDSSLD